MKITVTENKTYAEIMAMPKPKHEKPKKPNIFWRTLLKLVSLPSMIKTGFKCKKVGMERLGKKEPALILMNHSGFIDMEIVVSILYPRPLNIVTTSDAFIGMDWLLRQIGCIPTNKYTPDPTLVRSMLHAVRKHKSSVVLYPEASYSFDGTATEIGDCTGGLIKLLKVPVVMVKTEGAFHHTPLYNNLHVRHNKVSATMTYLLSPEDIERMSVDEINAVVNEQFSFDHFKWQKETQQVYDQPDRAEGLNRVLYKCPHCMAEGKMVGEGTTLTCNACGKVWEMDVYGQMVARDGNTEIAHIPDWYKWERQCVREEILRGEYSLDCDVDILMTRDTKKLYRIGSGHLTHDVDRGFILDGCDGQLHFERKPLVSHTLYADYFWYELGDIINIGNADYMYYCFPKGVGDVVAKTRLAAEEIYKIKKAEKAAAK
ncbi:MAG: 1-acyl-sn-glycerol-3-phosphate acyltransferase [Clostridia bacterium]|nr:1-acyl-sn-glycerol-3-phosphate acyltransferase [Clostridia bacterium]